ncbi:hypothetical protein [Streptomyces sp. NPDC001903]|uniref:hypothetical protein n=1 Tax=Streptomyces sp. NPDC001903 TaxID=3364622 RepID=UPI0036C45266
MLPNRRTAAAAIGALALAGALISAAPAQADSASPAPTAPKTAKSAPKGDGAKAICRRLPKTETRVSAAITRLKGDPAVLGSVARLEQRVAKAQAAGHTEVQAYLNDRLTFRKNLLPTLQKRQDDLKAVSTWCASEESK